MESIASWRSSSDHGVISWLSTLTNSRSDGGGGRARLGLSHLMIFLSTAAINFGELIQKLLLLSLRPHLCRSLPLLPRCYNTMTINLFNVMFWERITEFDPLL